MKYLRNHCNNWLCCYAGQLVFNGSNGAVVFCVCFVTGGIVSLSSDSVGLEYMFNYFARGLVFVMLGVGATQRDFSFCRIERVGFANSGDPCLRG